MKFNKKPYLAPQEAENRMALKPSCMSSPKQNPSQDHGPNRNGAPKEGL
jgi:hypothetical protein